VLLGVTGSERLVNWLDEEAGAKEFRSSSIGYLV
jgi:hypothetical protein